VDNVRIAAREAHSAASAYRMMDADELEALAELIKADGLLDPITVGVIGEERFIVDGRNRLRACEIAGVAPRFVEIAFEDDAAVRRFVHSRGNGRRSITKGQQAIATAMLFPDDGGKGGRGKRDPATNSLTVGGFGRELLRQARAVLAYSPELASEVRDGATPLKEAFEKVKAARERSEFAEAQRQRLAQEAPDLAVRVKEESLSLSEAISVLEIRTGYKQVVACAVEIGRHLIEAREVITSDGDWALWLERALRWTDDIALPFISATEEFAKTGTVTDLNVDFCALHLLAEVKSAEPAPVLREDGEGAANREKPASDDAPAIPVAQTPETAS
jgi:hypothetical protein